MLVLETIGLLKIFFSRALEIQPNDNEAQQGRQSARVSELSNQAYSFHIAGDTERAKTTYRLILDLEPDNDFANTNLRQILDEETGE